MNIKINSFCKHKNLSILQFETDKKNTFDYISGPSAVNSDLVKISEIDNLGSVNNLLVKNLSDKFLFFTDGDILVGAKQNRVINISIMLEPKSKTKIPVSCVESGRWSYRGSANFKSSNFMMPRDLRLGTRNSVYLNMLKNGSYYADQSKVWDSIDDYFEKIQYYDSPTMDLNSSLEANIESYEEFLEHFKVDNNSNGLAIFYYDNLASIEVFNRDIVYQEYFPKLIKSAAAEAYNMIDKNTVLNEDIAIRQTNDMLSKLKDQKYISKKTPGVGKLQSFTDDKISGLILNYNDHLIHLSILNLVNLNSNRDEKLRFGV